MRIKEEKNEKNKTAERYTEKEKSDRTCTDRVLVLLRDVEGEVTERELCQTHSKRRGDKEITIEHHLAQYRLVLLSGD